MDIIGDIIAGVSVSILTLAQGFNFAVLAGLPPVYGLYCGFYQPIIYFVFGMSRQVSVGTFAIISLMIGQVVRDQTQLYNDGVSSSPCPSLYYFNSTHQIVKMWPAWILTRTVITLSIQHPFLCD